MGVEGQEHRDGGGEKHDDMLSVLENSTYLFTQVQLQNGNSHVGHDIIEQDRFAFTIVGWRIGNCRDEGRHTVGLEEEGMES